MGKPASRSRTRRLTVRRRLLVERLGDRRVLAAISGAVFEDANFSFQREVGEANAPARLVFIDANQNERLDAGESVSVADSDGAFRFDNLADGTYLVRLFNGTLSQIQTVPFEATTDGTVLSVDNASQFASLGSEYLAINSESIVIGDLATGSRDVISLSDQVAKMQPLPDGKWLLVGSDPQGASSWLFDPQVRTVSQLDLSGQGSVKGWSNLAIDASGRGLLLEQSDQPFALRAVDASMAGADIQVATTTTMVPADTQVLASDSGNRSVLAWGGADGLQLSLWSNVTASPISSAATELVGASQLLAFDDASGLLAVRTIGGGISVLDVDANFAAIQSLDGVSGPIAIDGSRELLVTISLDEAVLKMISLRDGGLVANLAVDLSAIGPVSSLSFRDRQSIGMLGAAGIAEIALRKPTAREVKITDGKDSDPILFGVAVNGSNTAPSYDTVPVFSTDEDVQLIEAAPRALQGSSDAQGDQYVLLQRTEAGHGIAILQIDGAVSYTPDPDFNGSDSIVVLLHDGRDLSAEVTLEITVHSVPDAPAGIQIVIDPVPENVKPGAVIGDIEIIDADGFENLIIEVMDPRFGVVGDEIVFLGGLIDFETEPNIMVPVVVTDPETGDRIEKIFALKVTDRNDPILGISPDKAQIRENDEGGFVALIGVDDGDDKQTHTLTVDDDRFRFVGHELRLAPGVSLDFEVEPFVVIKVTATENIRNGNSLTEPITVVVGDVPEQPQAIQLTDDVVMEKLPGDIVGDVRIDGGPPDPRFQLSVDDARFEIVDGTLKLLDNQIVEQASQSEIELKITAQDSQRVFEPISQSFLIRVMENDAPYHNHLNPYDVDHSGKVSALDALAIINYLNVYGPGPVEPNDIGYCFDVNSDAMVTALDALLVLNELNRINVSGGTVGSGERRGEGETSSKNNTTGTPILVPNTDLSQSGPVPSDANGFGEDDVFGELGRDEKTPSISTAETQARLEDPAVEIPETNSDESFAENVDQTLRLLSDQSG